MSSLQHDAQLQPNEPTGPETARLSTLAEATQAFAEAAPDYQLLLEVVAQRISESTDSACTVRLLSNDGQWLLPVASYHPDLELRTALWSLMGQTTLRSDAGLWKRPLEERRLLRIEVGDQAYSTDTSPAQADFMRRYSARCVMGAPLVARDRVLGGIAVIRFGDRSAYTDQDESLFRELANRAALAIDNARLYQDELKAHARAEATVRQRDEFLMIAAHELRTPVTVLLGFAQLGLNQLGKQRNPPELSCRRTLTTIEKQSLKLSQLVNNLLEFSRIESGRMNLERDLTDLTRLVEEVVAAARQQTNRHEFVVRAPLRAPLLADPIRLEQVLANLVDNAIRFSPEGGPIEIEVARPASETIELAVTDHGIGIPAEERSAIFSPMYRAHARDYRSGLGLGLYVAHEIVALHGGELAAEFPPESGTRFVIRLPAITQEPSGAIAR